LRRLTQALHASSVSPRSSRDSGRPRASQRCAKSAAQRAAVSTGEQTATALQAGHLRQLLLREDDNDRRAACVLAPTLPTLAPIIWPARRCRCALDWSLAIFSSSPSAWRRELIIAASRTSRRARRSLKGGMSRNRKPMLIAFVGGASQSCPRVENAKWAAPLRGSPSRQLQAAPANISFH
jgi:hypothetical protein